MSRSEAHDESVSAQEAVGFAGLERAVSRAVSRIRTLEEGLREARARNGEVEELLERMTSGEESPARMAERLSALQSENDELRGRLEEGRAIADRLLARVRYLEEHG